MVRETLKYKVDNIDSFFENFKKYVDVTVNKRQVLWNFCEIKKDYFGKIEYKKFSAFHLKKRFAYRRIILEINGEIDNGELLVKVKDYSFVGQLFTFIALTILSVFIILKSNFYLGLAVFVINCLQTILQIRIVNKSLDRFKSLMTLILSAK